MCAARWDSLQEMKSIADEDSSFVWLKSAHFYFTRIPNKDVFPLKTKSMCVIHWLMPSVTVKNIRVLSCLFKTFLLILSSSIILTHLRSERNKTNEQKQTKINTWWKERRPAYWFEHITCIHAYHMAFCFGLVRSDIFSSNMLKLNLLRYSQSIRNIQHIPNTDHNK